MKIKLIFLCFVALSVLFYSCNGVKGDGHVVTLERDLTAFTHLEVSGSFDVTIEQADTYKAVLEIDSNLIENIHFDTSGRNLRIKEQKTVNQHVAYKIKISFPSIEHITINKNIQLNTNKAVNLESLRLQINDNSQAHLDLEVKKLTLGVYGNSLVSINGNTKTLDLTAEDNSDVKAKELNNIVVHLEANDNSQVEVHCEKELKGNITGNATVRYRGAPTKNYNTRDRATVFSIP